MIIDLHKRLGACRTSCRVRHGELVMKFRKKPVVIEAVKWTGKNHREMYNFLEGTDDVVEQPTGKNFDINFSLVAGGLVIKTLEGQHIASIGDWIIKGVANEFYPCKPDIFEATYESV